MSVNSYIKLIQIVDDFAQNHMQIQRFTAEFEEQLPNFATQSEAYPILFMSPVGTQFLSNIDTYTVRFYCYDVIQKDRANINNILSDTNLILNDLKKWFIDGQNFEFMIQGEPSATPINNALLDYVAGWQMDVTFNVASYCVDEIPFSGSPLITTDGIDVIYTRYLTCETVTGCTSFQEYIENAIANVGGQDIFVTGGTYNQSNGIATFTNNTGGTFSVSGFTVDTGQDLYWVSGSTWDGTNFPIKANNDSGLDATGAYSVAEGNATLASGDASHAEGQETTASGRNSHAEGYQTIANANEAHAEGVSTFVNGQAAHAEGWFTTAEARYSHAEGNSTTANGIASHVEGESTTAIGDGAHAEGNSTTAEGNYSHAEGYLTYVSGDSDGGHAEGVLTTALGRRAHAEGLQTTASGLQSHAQNGLNIASGDNSHAEGYQTVANGFGSHSQGQQTTASGDTSFASGKNSSANGTLAFVHGSGSQANGNTTIVLGNNITGTSSNTVYVPNIQFDLNAPSTMDVGRMEWNDTDGTVDLRLKGNNVTLQLGQEQLVRVVNKTGSNLLESQYRVVRFRRVDEGGAQGQRPAVVLAQGNNDPNSVDTIGIVTENIDNNQEGFITTFGIVRDINTTGSLQGETWVDGDVLYLSPFIAGELTNIKPTAPNHTVIMGYVIYAHNNQGKIFVKVDNGYELDELHNVNISGVTDGQALTYSSSLSAWTNTTISAGGSSTFTATLTGDTNNLNASIDNSGNLLLSPSTNLKLTGLQGGSNGRTILLVNTSNSYTIILENNSSASTSTNVFNNPAGEYIVILPTDAVALTYYNNKWNTEYLSFHQQLELFSDLTGYATGAGNFTNNTYFVDGPWRFLGGGSTPTSNSLPRPVTNQKKGVVTISMSRSPSALVFYGSPIVGLSQGGVADSSAGTTRFINARFTVGDVAFNAATQNIYVTMGVANGSLAASALGAYWSADATYANWQCVTDIGPTSTITDSGLPVVASVTTPPAASEYYTLGVVVHRSNGVSTSNAGFFSVDANGVVTWNVREVNTNIPTSGISPTLQWNGGGTLINTTPNIYIDYLGYKIIGGSR